MMMISQRSPSEGPADELSVHVGGQLRYRGSAEGRLSFVSDVHGRVMLTNAIGSLLTGLDLDRAIHHGPQAVLIERARRAELQLVVRNTHGEVALVGEGLEFDPSETSIARVLAELGL